MSEIALKEALNNQLRDALAASEQRANTEREIADRACAEQADTEHELELALERNRELQALLDRMGGFLDGMYRRPPPIVIDLLAAWEAITPTPAQPAAGEERT